jgi:hypothetical protein
MMRQRPGPGWSQSPGWDIPLDDPHPLRAAGPLGRWLWPVTAVGSFLVVVSYVIAHDPPPHPGLSDRGLLTVALAAVVVVMLAIRRAAGPGPLARAVAEYAVVALVAVLLATGAGAGQQSADGAEPADTAASAGQDRPAVVRAAVGVRDWLADLWRRADHQADRRSRASSTTTPEPRKGRATVPSPADWHPDRRPL